MDSLEFDLVRRDDLIALLGVDEAVEGIEHPRRHSARLEIRTSFSRVSLQLIQPTRQSTPPVEYDLLLDEIEFRSARTFERRVQGSARSGRRPRPAGIH